MMRNQSLNQRKRKLNKKMRNKSKEASGKREPGERMEEPKTPEISCMCWCASTLEQLDTTDSKNNGINCKRMLQDMWGRIRNLSV